MSSSDADRTVVKTYIPRYQKDNWCEEADELSMSQSEYVRSMVQAGRRDIHSEDPEEGEDSTVTPRGYGLKEWVLHTLESDGPLTWGELADHLEEELETTMNELQQSNRIQHRPRHGDYVPKDG